MNWSEVQNIGKNDPVIRGKVVGMSFVPEYPAKLYLLFKLHPEGLATLRRNPGNKYDTNACEVYLNGDMVGHLPRDLAAEVAPRLDTGEEFSLELNLLVTPGKEDNPGVSFQLLFKENR